MDVEAFAKTGVGRLWIKVIGAGMESRLRYRFFGPEKILAGTDLCTGDTVLEIGCGTGFFTIPAAKLIGNEGSLVAMDILPESVATVSAKVRSAGLKHVLVVKGDALNTALETEQFDAVLLFGVIPAPVLPLARLLPELNRVLKADGLLAIWPPVPGWLPGAVLRSELFTLSGKRNHVYNFRRR